MFIILKFVNNNLINISDLSNELQVSRRTLSNDLYNLNILLEEYNLKIDSLNGYGVMLIGKEIDKRKLFHEFSLKLIFEWKYLPQKLSDFFIEPQKVVKIKEIDIAIKKLLKNTQLFQISSILNFWISTLIYISIARKEHIDSSTNAVKIINSIEIDNIFNKDYSLTNYEKEKISTIFFEKIWLKEKQNLSSLFQIFEKDLKLDLSLNEDEYIKFNSILEIIAIKNFLNMKELNFFNINSIIEKRSEFKGLKKLIEQNLKNADTSDLLNFTIYFVNLMHRKIKLILKNEEKIVFVYHMVSINLVKSVCEVLDLNDCCDIVSAFDFDRYFDSNTITGIISLEDIYLNKKHSKLKKLRINYPVVKLERLLLYKLIKN